MEHLSFQNAFCSPFFCETISIICVIIMLKYIYPSLLLSIFLWNNYMRRFLKKIGENAFADESEKWMKNSRSIVSFFMLGNFSVIRISKNYPPHSFSKEKNSKNLTNYILKMQFIWPKCHYYAHCWSQNFIKIWHLFFGLLQ